MTVLRIYRKLYKDLDLPSSSRIHLSLGHRSRQAVAGGLARVSAVNLDSVADVWSRVMDFDAAAFRAVGIEGAPPIERWLLEHTDAWLNPMRRPEPEKSVAERVFIIVGEAGSGKTTLMEVISQHEKLRRGFPLYFDFKNVPTLDGSMQEGEAIEAISDFLRDTIELAVEDAGLKAEYTAAKARFIVRNRTTDELEELVELYPTLKRFTDEQLLACKEVLSEVRRYEIRHPEQFIPLVASQFLPSWDRTVILIDNVEGLDPAVREILFRKLTSTQQGRSLLFVAIRSENQRQAEVLLQGRRDEPYLLDREWRSLLEIARIRNDGAKKLCDERMSHLDANEVAQFHEEFAKSLEAIEANEYLLSLFTGWLNDNVRNFLTLIADMSLVLPKLEGRSIKGFISSKLLERRAHSSLQGIFDMQAVYSDKYKSFPFVFLPFRLLVYLQNRGGTVKIAEIVRDFESSFGISASEIERAIDRFDRVENGKPSLLRREKGRDGQEQVHLLRCGETFVQHVVYQCDFLQTLFDRVENPPTMGPGLSKSELKLRRSIAVIEELILPSFEAEHPYINTRATNRMRRRLFEYERMFSYKHGHWFVGALRIRLHSYAIERGLLAVAAPVVRRLNAVEDRLNFVSKGGR